jgi:hypothetical protein
LASKVVFSIHAEPAHILDRARAAGPTVMIEGDRLVITGPRRAADLARELIAHKAEILEMLRPGAPAAPPAPTPWRDVLAGWPDPLRKRWGLHASELEDQGLSWWRAERQAFAKVSRLKHPGVTVPADTRRGGADHRPPGTPPGGERQGTFTWDELAARRWGPARGDPIPGIVIDRPDRGRMLAALQSAADDPKERAIIRTK